MTGCPDGDERVAQVAERAAARQAAQNQQSQEVTQATRSLVEADAKARAAHLESQRAFQQEVQQERESMDRQRNILENDRRAHHAKSEQERQQLLAAREREPIIANAIYSAAVLAGCFLPLLICIYVLRAMVAADPDDALGDLLVHELVTADSPLSAGLLAAPMDHEQRPAPELPAPSGPSC